MMDAESRQLLNIITPPRTCRVFASTRWATRRKKVAFATDFRGRERNIPSFSSKSATYAGCAAPSSKSAPASVDGHCKEVRLQLACHDPHPQKASRVTASTTSAAGGLGFLTVLFDEGQGWIGGYLVVNAAARPLEFHCTAPVKPNRAQEILYGPTLGCYLMGEQIAAALVKKSSSPPLAVFTDVEPVLALRSQIDSPVALLVDQVQGESPALSSLVKFEIGGRRVAVSEEYGGDRERLLATFPRLAQNFDLAEPLDRIREAIAETQLRGRAA